MIHYIIEGILVVLFVISYIIVVKIKKLYKEMIINIAHELDGVDGLLPHDNIRLNRIRKLINPTLDL